MDPDDIEATVGAEAAEIMRRKQGVKKHKDTESALVKEKAFEGWVCNVVTKQNVLQEGSGHTVTDADVMWQTTTS